MRDRLAQYWRRQNWPWWLALMLAGISLGERIVGWVANAEFIVSNSDRLHWADDVFFHPLFGLGALLVGFGGLMVFGRTQGIEATKKTPIPQEGSPTHMAALLPDKIWVPNPKSREGVVERLSQFKGLECEIVWATGGKFFRYSGAEQLAQYLKEMLEEAGWAITAYREEDIEQQSRPGVADDVVTLGHWHLDHEEAFQALNGSLYFDLPMTRHSKIGVDFNHPKDKLPRITVWSRGGLGI